MEKRILQFLCLLVLLIGAWHFWNPFWKSDLNEAVDSTSSEKIVFSVEKGSSAKQIAGALESADLIVSENSFVKTVENEGLDGKLRYGSFVLSPSMTLREVVTVLTTEGTGELAFTVPEGWTIEDMDLKLTELGLIEAGAFKECTLQCDFSYDFLDENQNLEGYLFPDTYFVDSATFSVESLINQMLQNFDKKWTEKMQATLDASGRTLDELVNVASMLEKEVRTQPDLPLVAGIIWKRLDDDWTLGIDATLLYKDEDHSLTAEDLAEESPYNTRLNTGLPPTPICNPGLASLEAALEPKASDYWFYLTDSEGDVHYASTNAEHEENKAAYIE
ncbi:endolytic transglycosylase MltG [Candidatus Peregrinibacteria bacterium]|nr:MAG: endolytic transglycosylase MltG [Candidatus Peregrinibacteria bacterium]